MDAARPNPRYPHLPPGRAPGKQTRNRRVGRRIWVALLVLLAGFLFGLAIYGASDPGESSPAVFLLVFGFMGAAALLVAWFVYRRAAPRQRGARHFVVSAQPLELRRGGELEAELRILDPSKVTEAIEVGLVCTEYYDHEQTHYSEHGSNTSRETAEAIAHQEWVPASGADRVQSFRFRVPDAGPFSHEGAALSFAWRLSAREQRRRRRDPSSDQPIWVLP